MTSLSPIKCVRVEDIAYIAGLVASDGHIDREFHKISIGTSDKEFAYIVLKMLRSMSENTPHIYGKKTAYSIEIWDKDLRSILTQKYKIPVEKKSDILTKPEIPKSEVASFIRGFCDGDSSIHHRRMRKRFVPRIRIMSCSKEILEWIKQQLIEMGIRCGSPFIDMPHGFGTKLCYRIEIYGTSVKKFKEKIGYLHPAKSKKLDELILLLN